MDWATSSAGVRKPRLVRQRRFPMYRAGPALSKRQQVQVKRLVHQTQELKYIAFNSGVATQATSTMSVSNTPFAIPQGVTDQDRVGDSITYGPFLKLRINIANGQGATGDIYNNVRVAIVQWKPNTVPTAGDIFLNDPSGAPGVYSNYSHDKRQMFNILFDKVWTTIGNAAAAGTANTSAFVTGVQDLTISLKRAVKHVQYLAGGTSGTNLLYICIVSDSALATHPNFTYQTKLVYRDG